MHSQIRLNVIPITTVWSRMISRIFQSVKTSTHCGPFFRPTFPLRLNGGRVPLWDRNSILQRSLFQRVGSWSI
jgi:hypothetical protein